MLLIYQQNQSETYKKMIKAYISGELYSVNHFISLSENLIIQNYSAAIFRLV